MCVTMKIQTFKTHTILGIATSHGSQMIKTTINTCHLHDSKDCGELSFSHTMYAFWLDVLLSES